MGNVSRLPKWAQQQIQTLKDAKEYWKEKVLAVTGGETEVWLRDYTCNKPVRRCLPSDSRVVFRVSEQLEVEVRIEGDQAIVHATTRMGGRMVVLPRVANEVAIGIDERRD